MMQLHSTKPKKKWPWIVGVCVVIVLLLAGSGVYVTMQARNQFTAQTQDFSVSIKNQLTEQTAAFKNAHDTPSNQKSQAQLGAIESLATSLLDQVPSDPKVLGVSVADTPQRDSLATLRQRLFDLQRASKESKEFISYKSQVLALLTEVKDKPGKTLDDQKALVATWNTTYTKIKEVVPPQQAQTAHNDLVASLESITATLASLPELYEKKDYSGYNAKRQELESKIAGLREVSNAFHALSQEYDKAIAAPLTALLK